MKHLMLKFFLVLLILISVDQVSCSSINEDQETKAAFSLTSSSMSSKPAQEKSIWGIGEEQLDELFDTSSNVICLADYQIYHRINTAYLKTFGGSEAETLKQPYNDRVHPEDQQATKSMADQSFRNSLGYRSSVLLDSKDKFQMVLNFENRRLTQCDDYRNIEWLLLLQVTGSQTQAPILCIGQDVTLKKQAEIQKQELEQAQLATRMKSTFVAHISHELRTPLNGIIGFLDLALEEEVSDNLKNYLIHARESAGLLLEIADNIVDVSRLEAGMLKMQKDIFNPVDSLNMVINLLKKQAAQKDINIKFSTSASMPTLLQGDEYRFQQILSNLGSNAVKYTQHGKVSFKLENYPVPDQPQQIMIRGRIKDTGIGINPQFIPKLFRPFSQEDQSMKRDFGGTGLGLYLTKELCERMGGSIHVLSTPGLGSTFEFKVIMTSSETL